MTVDLVVARYKENVSWIDELPSDLDFRAFVYDKGREEGEPCEDPNSLYLPNVGREPHTYVHHIVSRYDRLADWTVFVQGDPTEHLGLDPKKGPHGTAFHQAMRVLLQPPFPPPPITSIYWFRTKDTVDYLGQMKHAGEFAQAFREGRMRRSTYTLAQYFEHVLRLELPPTGELLFAPGACFGASREAIKKHDRLMWRDILWSLTRHSNPEEAHYMERAWYYLLT